MRKSIILLIIISSQIIAGIYDFESYIDILEDDRKMKEMKYQDNKAKIEKQNREKLNNDARIANEKAHRERLLKAERLRKNREQSSYVKEEFKPQDFKNKPQIIYGKLHILGVKSIKPFKGDKYIIKATSGTYALPKDKLEEASKINFTKELKKWRFN